MPAVINKRNSWLESLTKNRLVEEPRTNLMVVEFYEFLLKVIQFFFNDNENLQNTVRSQFKKALFKKESRFKKDCCYNQFSSMNNNLGDLFC